MKSIIRLGGFLVLALTVFVSCQSIKPNASKGNKSLFETFYVGNEGTQYFIKPIGFESIEKGSAIYFDFTFRYHQDLKQIVNINFSIYDNQVYKEIDSIVIVSNDKEMKLMIFDKLFSEKSGKQVVSRFKSQSEINQLADLFLSNHWKISVYSKGVKNEFQTSKAVHKKLTQINENLFYLIR